MSITKSSMKWSRQVQVKRNRNIVMCLDAFCFREWRSIQKIKVLSGGEKSRVALAKTLISEANFCCWTNPPTTWILFQKTFWSRPCNNMPEHSWSFHTTDTSSVRSRIKSGTSKTSRLKISGHVWWVRILAQEKWDRCWTRKTWNPAHR